MSQKGGQNVSGFLIMLGASFLFAMLASEIAFVYLHLGGFFRYPENFIISGLIVLVFSLAGGFFANDPRICRNVAVISSLTISISAFYMIEHKLFSSFSLYLGNGLIGSLFLVTLTSGIYDSLRERKIEKKHTIYFIVLAVIGIVLFTGYGYSYAIVAYLDQHPWIATILVAFVTLIGGYFLGKRGKK